MSDPKIIEFPKPRRRHQEMDSDERYAAEVFTAYRALRRKIEAARQFGLTVEYNDIRPKITKHYG
jgi:cell fate (sporulation/competence/biofilm development) regulator YlbF (YheA/YmcA/DUF963 family)